MRRRHGRSPAGSHQVPPKGIAPFFKAVQPAQRRTTECREYC